MGFRTAYGYKYSENGWRMCDRAECNDGALPGLPGLRLPIRNGDARTILGGWISWFNANVEALNNRRGFTDEGCWTQINDVGNSNHLSGTAVDINWSEHAFRVADSGFTPSEISQTRKGLLLFENTIWWGNDWRSPKDAMHFQLNLTESNPKNAEFAKKLRGGYLGIWKGDIEVLPPPTSSPSNRPLLEIGSFGPVVGKLQAAMNLVFRSYKAMPLDVDNDYGPMTASAVAEFQTRVGITVDGVVGDETWDALKVYGIKP